MSLIPKSHPRARSLEIREKLADGFRDGLVAVEGLLAEGRGEAFDYLAGEKTSRAARAAIKAAAAQLLLAQRPVISVNGNVAALCPADIIKLAETAGAKVEVNLFYADDERRRKIVRVLEKNGADRVFGKDKKNSVLLSGVDSARRTVDRDGIFMADVVVVPLEDGDRTGALKGAGKKVIAFDLNPISRTSQDADITIVDNITRAVGLLEESCKRLSGSRTKTLERITGSFDNKKNLVEHVLDIRNHLTKRARHA